MLHLLPGLGATPALYKEYPFTCETKACAYRLPASKCLTLADYAAFIIETQSIQPGDDVIGTSFGGMLACEISAQVTLRKLTLISSSPKWEYLSPLLRKAAFMAPFVPWPLIRLAAWPLPFQAAADKEAVHMFRQSDMAFVRWATLALTQWGGRPPVGDCLQIHGDRDLIFPLSLQPTLQTVISGGGHLMVLARAGELFPMLAERHA